VERFEPVEGCATYGMIDTMELIHAKHWGVISYELDVYEKDNNDEKRVTSGCRHFFRAMNS
jgi:hypothetical protein